MSTTLRRMKIMNLLLRRIDNTSRNILKKTKAKEHHHPLSMSYISK